MNRLIYTGIEAKCIPVHILVCLQIVKISHLGLTLIDVHIHLEGVLNGNPGHILVSGYDNMFAKMQHMILADELL